MGFLDFVLGRRKKQSSGELAKERLRLVLAHDRCNLEPGMLDKLKDEIVAVISRHVEIDPDGVEVSFSQDARENRLVADIPIVGRRKR